MYLHFHLFEDRLSQPLYYVRLHYVVMFLTLYVLNFLLSQLYSPPLFGDTAVISLVSTNGYSGNFQYFATTIEGSDLVPVSLAWWLLGYG
jgi:hypothetical protein